MKPDQIERLQQLTEQLAEVFITEADPSNWNGAGLHLTDMSKEVRGNRLWDKKNAMASGVLLARALDLVERTKPGLEVPGDEDDVDGTQREMDRFEMKAKKLLQHVQDRSKH